jgi:hypothetical protein
MELRTAGMYAVTTIHDRSGRRVGSYLVDKSKDSLNRDHKNSRNERENLEQEQAVVFHSSEESDASKRADRETPKDDTVTGLNLTV